MQWKIPLFDLEYDEREENAVLDVLRSKWLTMGDRTVQFERALEALLGGGRVLATSSCTAALHMAVRAAGVGPGDEVIVPDLTFVATANAVLYQGATPVFADVVSERDLTVDPADIARKITPLTKAIMVVHYAGYPCHMREILAIAEEHGLAVIEDCAHAPGASYEGRALGTLGDFGCFSFFSNKNVSTGEGGAIWCRDDDVAETLRLMRSHGMTAQTLDRHKGHAWGYDVVDVGYNYRLTEIEAALGLVQLEKLETNNAARARNARLYHELLASILGLVVPFAGFEDEWPFNGQSSYHIMVVLLPPGVSQITASDHLREAGIQTSVHYRPLHTFSGEQLAQAPAEGLETIRAISDRILTLPLWPGMAEEQVREVVAVLAEVAR